MSDLIKSDIGFDHLFFFFWMWWVSFIMSSFEVVRQSTRCFYSKVMKCLSVQWIRPKEWRYKTWMLHHDSAPANLSLLISEVLMKHEVALVPRPPCSPDLALVDYFVPEVKIHQERSAISNDGRDIKWTTGPIAPYQKTSSRTHSRKEKHVGSFV